jgi:hypothetical protein
MRQLVRLPPLDSQVTRSASAMEENSMSAIAKGERIECIKVVLNIVASA